METQFCPLFACRWPPEPKQLDLTAIPMDINNNIKEGMVTVTRTRLREHENSLRHTVTSLGEAGVSGAAIRRGRAGVILAPTASQQTKCQQGYSSHHLTLHVKSR